MINDIYAAEPHLIARLKEKIPSAATVANISAFSGDVSPRIDPLGIFIRPMAIRKVKDGNGCDPEIVLPWGIVICVPHVYGLDTPDTTTQNAGPHVLRVIQIFSGWKIPVIGMGLMRLVSEQPQPEFSINGRAEFPILFETQFSIESDTT